jgi:PAS domain S-box-containing protein
MKSVSLKIVITYAFSGILWMIFSDLIFVFATDKNDHPVLVMGTISGFVFLVITSVILYKLISIHFKRLQRSEKQYRGYFEDNPTPMWLYNRKTLKFTDVNNSAIFNYGFAKDEFLQMSILDIRPLEEHQKVMDAVHTFEHDYKNSGVWTHMRKDGTIIFAQVASHLTYLADGPHVMVMAKDITARLQAEVQLKKVNNDLIRQNNTLKEIAWAESHNVRRPLTSILGLLEVLRGTTDEKERELCLNYIEISAAELDIMIHRVSDQINDAVTIEDDIKQKSMAFSAMLQ